MAPPAVRSTRQRAINNENDENAGTTRVTRAKAALGSVDSAADPPQKALQTKRTTTTLGVTKTRRAALGDLSNVTKLENGVGAKDGKDAKKALANKPGAVAKAAHPSKVQKTTRAGATTRPKSSAATELKRPASGSGIVGNATKKRQVSVSTTKALKEEDHEEVENLEPVQTKAKAKKDADAVVDAKDDVIKHGRAVTPVEEVFEPAPEPEEYVLPEGVLDLDREDMEDPLMVSEYVNEIFVYLKSLEAPTMPNPDYMENQPELEWKMRGILVDWLLEVHTRFRLLPETLFLAVNIIDRFLSNKMVQLDRLQLVGVTAMFIASKYEEVLSPHVQNFRHVADDGFTEEEILSAERFVLAALDYSLSYPNPMNFLRRISKADNYDIQTRTLGKYLIEISCLDYRFLPFPPSQVAAAAMYLSRLVLERGEWDATIAHYAGYTEEEIQPVLQLMIDYLAAPVVHEAFFKKYASKKFLKASIILRRWAKEYVSSFGKDLQTSSKSSEEAAA